MGHKVIDQILVAIWFLEDWKNYLPLNMWG